MTTPADADLEPDWLLRIQRPDMGVEPLGNGYVKVLASVVEQACSDMVDAANHIAALAEARKA